MPAPSPTLFITGTSTAVGKTYVATLILKGQRASGCDAIAFKPVSCGGREDAEALHEAMGGEQSGLSLDEVNPIHFASPASPYAAALIENRAIGIAGILEHLEILRERGPDHLLVEGAGGWEVPLNAQESMADLAVAIGAPVLVVVDNRLGALNHTMLTVKNIRSRGLKCAGIVLNSTGEERDAASISNRRILEDCLPEAPVLAEIIHGQSEWEGPLDGLFG